MTRAIGFALAVTFLITSLVGTAGTGWLLGHVVIPTRTDSLAEFGSPTAYLIALAMLAEALRLTLSLQGERIWERSRFQAATFAAPLWLACMAYCTLVPLLTLAIVYVTTASVLTIIAVAWTFIQLAAGLLPGIGWRSVLQDGLQPAAQAEASPMEAEAAAPELPAHLVPKFVASAEDFLQLLSRLARLPEGSRLPQKGRIGANCEIVMSQGALANLVGRSKPTVRRWLQELEQSRHITKNATGKETHIRLHAAASGPDALNGHASH
jgi:hypothetical protein